MKKENSKVVVIAQSLKEIIKRYPAVKKEKIEKAVLEKCKYYSKIDEDSLEANFGFDKGRKWEFIQQIADSVLLVNENYDKVDTSFESFDFKGIYDKILGIIKYYVDLREEYYPIISLWIIGTYFHDSFYTFPYLYFNAMKSSGKSRLLNLIKTLSKDGEKLTSLTEAVLFREKGTLAIDEFEGVGKKGGESLRELLNTAYKKGGRVKRMRKVSGKDGEKQEVEVFEVYRPILIANIYGMEEVLSDRCIEMILEKSSDTKRINLIENFDTSPIIMGVVEAISKGNGSCGSLEHVFRKAQNGWNEYINPIETTTPNSPNTLITPTTPTTPIYRLYNNIKKCKLDGRNLELFFPLYLLADKCGVLKEILDISVEIVRLKKESDLYQAKDVQVYEFISKVGDDHGSIRGLDGYVKVKELNNLFREYIGSEEKDKWPNTKWMGHALKRLNLIREKKKSSGMHVILNYEKAKEKMKMFIEPEEEVEVVKIGSSIGNEGQNGKKEGKNNG